MGIGKNILQGVRQLFGKSTKNEIPVNLDIIQFNSTTNQWELVTGVIGSAVQSASNVGTGDGVSLPRVLDDLPFKTFLAGSGIQINVTPTTLEIESTQKSIFLIGYHTDKNWKQFPDVRYGAMFTNKQDQAVEADANSVMGVAFTVKKITLFLSMNSSIDASEITLKRNGVAIPATKITIPALTSGLFTVTGLSEVFSITDEIHEEHVIGILGADNDIKHSSYILECEN